MRDTSPLTSQPSSSFSFSGSRLQTSLSLSRRRRALGPRWSRPATFSTARPLNDSTESLNPSLGSQRQYLDVRLKPRWPLRLVIEATTLKPSPSTVQMSADGGVPSGPITITAGPARVCSYGGPWEGRSHPSGPCRLLSPTVSPGAMLASAAGTPSAKKSRPFE